jgi:hypothetical protein
MKRRILMTLIAVILCFTARAGASVKKGGAYSYAIMARECSIYPQFESGFLLRGRLIIKIFNEETLHLYPLAGVHAYGFNDFRLTEFSLLRRDPESRDIVFLNNKGLEGFSYEVIHDKDMSGGLPFVQLLVKGGVSQWILDIQWELSLESGSLRYLFMTGETAQDAIQTLTLHDPGSCTAEEVNCSAGKHKENKTGHALVWSYDAASLEEEAFEEPGVRLILKKQSRFR